MTFRFLVRWAIALGLIAMVQMPRVISAEIIYDNTSTSLAHYAVERREYGDQLDLEGTARNLTELAFECYASFTPDGTQFARVRLYSNEAVYDNYRNQPTRLLFESALIPLSVGYSAPHITNLNVPLPHDTVTFTVEFIGLKPQDEAGLLFYSPPTVGFSFNEFWARTPAGGWETIRYSTTDPALKANASVRLTAVPEPVLDQRQTNGLAALSLRDRRVQLRAAQTFQAKSNGRLDHISILASWTGLPLRLRLLDAPGGMPGTNELASTILVSSSNALQSVSFYPLGIHLAAGENYAIEYSTEQGFTPDQNYTLRCGTNSRSETGALWFRDEPDAWRKAVGSGGTSLSAVFEVWSVPGNPAARIASPRFWESLVTTQAVTIRAEVDLPPRKTLARVRFFANDQEIGQAVTPPFEFTWTNAPAGNHSLRAFAQDSLLEVYRSDPVTIAVRSPSTPVNDDFAGRVLLSGNVARASAPAGDATLQAGEPRLSTTQTGATLWWSWTASNNLPVTISVQNSDAPAAVGVFTGTMLETLVPVTNGMPACIFQPAAGTRYTILADPSARGGNVVLDIATADLSFITPDDNTTLKVPSVIPIRTAWSSARQLTNVQILANGILLREFSRPPYEIDQEFSAPGTVELTAAATDVRGVRTVSAVRRLNLLPDSRVIDAHAAVQRIADGSVSIIFDAPANVPVTIEYSDDLATWHAAQEPVTGTGARTAWIDAGPPRTERHPRATARRFYRLNFGF